jgi:hypothetical protein
VGIFGLKIGIRVRDPGVLESLLSRVPVGWVPLESASVDRLYSVVTPTTRRANLRHLCVLYGDHGRLIRTEELEDLLEYFESDLDLYIAANSREILCIHAGAVNWKGHTILLPGRSQTGKTTLVAEFLKSGAAYYSDDFAAIDQSGHLHSYPRDLSVRGESEIQRVRPEDLGATRAQPAAVSMVLFTEYAQGEHWNPKRISPGQGILRVLENTPSTRNQPEFALQMVGNAITNAEVHAGRRGEKEQTVERVLNYLDR